MAVDQPQVGSKLVVAPVRRSLPANRKAQIFEFQVGPESARRDVHVTVGFFEDGALGEIFISVSGIGSVCSEVLKAYAMQISLSMKYSVPLREIVDNMISQSVDPMALTGKTNITTPESFISYIGLWMGQTFIPGFVSSHQPDLPVNKKAE